jgi:hypothetical protein
MQAQEKEAESKRKEEASEEKKGAKEARFRPYPANWSQWMGAQQAGLASMPQLGMPQLNVQQLGVPQMGAAQLQQPAQQAQQLQQGTASVQQAQVTKTTFVYDVYRLDFVSA